MKKAFTLVLVVIVFILSGFSQASNQKISNTPRFVRQQQEFADWAKGRDLSKEKGWKVYKRWEDQMIKRANADGSLPDEYEYFKAAESVAALKNDQAQMNSRGIFWVPEGPFVAPGTVGRINTMTFHPSDASTFWVGVAQGGVWKTTNGGNSYLPLTDELPITRISDIAIDPLHPDTMYISVCDYGYVGIALHTDGRKRNTHYGMGVYKTIDGGSTWNPTGLAFNQTDFDGSLIRRTFVNSTNSNSLLAAGTSGIWTSANGGNTWSKILDTLIWDIERDPINKNTIYASGGYVGALATGYACILKSTDFGNTWTLLNTGIPPKATVQRIELCVSPADPNYVYALCCDMNRGYYGLYRSTNAGSTWSQRSNTPNIMDWGDGSSSGGQATYDMTILADGSDKNKIFTGGIYIWGSVDGGTTFNKVTDDIHPDQQFLAYNSLDQKTYLCNAEGIYVTPNLVSSPKNATSWTLINNNLQTPSYYRVATSKNNAGFLVAGAQDNGTIYYDKANWIMADGGDGMDCTIDNLNPQVMITSSQFGYFSKSTDGGQTSNGLNVTNEAGEWTTPILRDPTTNSTLYAGYTNLHKSVDNGDNWTPISNISGTPITAIAVCPQNSNYIYLTKRVSGTTMQGASAWTTSDGGSNWTDITAGLPDSIYFTGVAVDDNDPNTAWVTCGGFYNGVKIFKTIDAGATWSNISGNLPNIPVNCIVHQIGSANNTLYVGCDVGVFAIDDNFTSWQMYSLGLPNVIVSDLEIHYASNRLYAATFGRGIWSYDLSNNVSVGGNSESQELIQINPTVNSGGFELEINGIFSSGASVEFIDIAGRRIYSESLNFTNSNFSKQYLLDLTYGMYFVKVSFDSGKSSVQRFVVEW